MNNEDKMFELMEKMYEEIINLKTGQEDIKKRLSNVESDVSNINRTVIRIEDEQGIEGKVDNIENDKKTLTAKESLLYDQTALLRDFKEEISNKLDSMSRDINALEIVTSKNWNNLTKLKATK